MSAAGQVWAHVGQSFTETEFDLLVIGAGRMGAALAFYLRQLVPERSLLLAEEGGLPNEEGATILAPGVWTTLDLAPEQREAARWTREQLAAFGDIQFQARPLLDLGTGETATAAALADHPEALALIDPAALPTARLDPEAATYRPGSVALKAAQSAIRTGANLMLNARARLVPGGAELQRLTVTNTHQIVVHETCRVRAGVTVVAAGTAGPGLIEHGLGVHSRHARAYVQYPRLECPSLDTTPVLRVAGLMLRPQNGGYTLVPPVHHRDPQGYQPAGGHLTGVPTGLRRETLEDLVERMEAVPALATGALVLGRSSADIPGAWVALPGGKVNAAPLHEEALPGVHLLLGGPLADTLGLWTAHELARGVAGRLGG